MGTEAAEGVVLKVNGVEHAVDAPSSATLLDVLREDLDLTGAKKACDNGECGSCIVLMGGKPAKACLLAAKRAVGKELVTIEGLSPAAEGLQPGGDLSVLHPLQQAFLEKGATQCGFCIPGMIMRASVLLANNRLLQDHRGGALCVRADAQQHDAGKNYSDGRER